MLPFIVIPGQITAPIAEQLGGTDISAPVGLLVSAVAYYVLTRSLDLDAEAPAIEASERTIAETMP